MDVIQQQPIGSGFGAITSAQEVMKGVDLTGKTALVTGGYSGLGLETVRALSAAGAHVIVPARRPVVAREALADTPCSIIEMDLADQLSIHRAAHYVIRTSPRLDFVFAIAGVMATPERRVGPGWESQFAINHLGHFALINALVPHIADGARVICYSSAGHHFSEIRWDDVHFTQSYDKWAAYGQSKTANILFANELDRQTRSRGIRAFSLHPGPILTNLQRDLSQQEQIDLGWIDPSGNVVGEGFKTPTQGAATGLWAATSSLLEGHGGLYCENCDVAPIAHPGGTINDGGVKPYAMDQDNAARLWDMSVHMTTELGPHQ